MIYGRRIDEAQADIWMRIFTSANPAVLAIAIDYVTRNSERMPTPGMLTKAIAIAYEQHPELLPKNRLTYVVSKDTSGMPCIYWSDDPVTAAYKATDCPEGRRFLAELARIASIRPEKIAQLMEKWSASAQLEPVGCGAGAV